MGNAEVRPITEARTQSEMIGFFYGKKNQNLGFPPKQD